MARQGKMLAPRLMRTRLTFGWTNMDFRCLLSRVDGKTIPW